MKLFIVPLLTLLLAALVSAQVGITEYSNYATLTSGGDTTFTFSDGVLNVSSVVVHATDGAAENRGRLFVAEAFVSSVKERYFTDQGREVERYLLISPKGIAERNVDSITIYYSSPLQLYRDSNSGWEPLESWQDGSTYYATASSFGTFALAEGEVASVGGEQPEPEVEAEAEPEITEQESNEVEQPSLEPDTQPEQPVEPEVGESAEIEGSQANMVLIVAALVVVGVLVVAAYRFLKSTTAKERKK